MRKRKSQAVLQLIEQYFRFPEAAVQLLAFSNSFDRLAGFYHRRRSNAGKMLHGKYDLLPGVRSGLWSCCSSF